MALKSERGRGAFLIEAMAAVALVGIAVAVVSQILVDYRRSHDAFMARWAAQLAAEARMEAYRAGQPVVDGPVTVEDHAAGQPSPGDVRLEVESEPGTGDWAGLQRVTVKATAMCQHGRTATYRLTGYVRVGG